MASADAPADVYVIVFRLRLADRFSEGGKAPVPALEAGGIAHTPAIIIAEKGADLMRGQSLPCAELEKAA